tara:strand:+ start:18023 stop:18445 length:423 start_codon:yes stop_codon:yes gene_type:complete
MGGSVLNRLMSRKGYLLGNEPKVGDGATYMAYSDRYPLSVVADFKVGKKALSRILKLQEDNAKLVSGSMLSEGQEYVYSENPDGAVYYVREVDVYEDGVLKGRVYEEVYKNEKGNYVLVNNKNKYPIVFGMKEKYRDPSF